MIGKTNVGGGIRAYAYIVVEHPSGAAASCTNSRRAISLSSTMTMFLVSDGASSCAVSIAKSGEPTVTKTVAITSGGSYYLKLIFDYYLVKDGFEQNGNEFAILKKGFNNAEAPNGTGCTKTYENGYIHFLGNRASSRGGTVVSSSDIMSVVQDYAYLYIRCLRDSSDGSGSTAFHMKCGTFDENLNTYSTSCFLDTSDTITAKVDQSPVLLKKQLTNATYNSEAATVAFAFVVPGSSSGGDNIFVDIYDMWLSNEDIEV